MDYEHFMGAALEQAHEALARGEFPVGCVMVHRGRIIATGAREGTRGDGRNELDHAEMTALRRLSTHPAAPEPCGVSVFSTMEPCLMCFAALMLHGIGEIVFAFEDPMGGGTTCDRSRLSPLYRESRIRVRPGVRRRESLDLFKAFFAEPRNPYLRDSYLAEYTLRQ
jgi:tRNA(adenine34) deaminase